MLFWGKRKKGNQVTAQNENSSYAAVSDIKSNKRMAGTLDELRKQSRDEMPRFPVYPFTLTKRGNVVIPYTASVQEIIPYLRKDMTHFECGVVALVWKGVGGTNFRWS